MGETDEGGSAIQERQLCRKSNVRLYRRQGQGKSQARRHATSGRNDFDLGTTE